MPLLKRTRRLSGFHYSRSPLAVALQSILTLQPSPGLPLGARMGGRQAPIETQSGGACCVESQRGRHALKCAHSDVEKGLCVATSPRNDRLHFGSIGAMLVIFMAVFVLYLLDVIWGRWCARNRHSVSPAR